MAIKDLSAISKSQQARLLIIRPDRIGDVILSTPVFASLRAARPNWTISVMVRPAVAELLTGNPDVDTVITLETDDKPSFSNTRGLADKLRSLTFDLAIHLYSDFWLSLAVWRAGVPHRLGPASKLAQVFYNHTIKQRRSSGGSHEADYNLGLLAPLEIPFKRESKIVLQNGVSNGAKQMMDEQKKNVGVFPCMGGSARNWKPEKYAQLADYLSGKGVNVILMCGPGEEKKLDEVQSHTAADYGRYTGSTLTGLAAVIKALDCFVAPSTGPLHMASAVGTPAVGIYCPIRVCLPERWGPIGGIDKSFVPAVPVCDSCTGEQCGYYDCMDSIEVEPVGEAVMERI